MIWQLMGAVGFCVRRMWRYYSPFLPRAVSSYPKLSTAQIKRAKKTRMTVRRNPWLCAQSPCCTSFRRRSINIHAILADVMVKGRSFQWSCLQIGNLDAKQQHFNRQYILCVTPRDSLNVSSVRRWLSHGCQVARGLPERYTTIAAQRIVLYLKRTACLRLVKPNI